MTGPKDRDRLDDMATLWSTPVVPVDDADRTEARREPTVAAIGRAIRSAGIDRRRRRRQGVVFGALAAAASLILAVGAARWGTAEDAAGETPVAVVAPAAPPASLEATQGALALERGGHRQLVAQGARQELREGDVIVSELRSSGTVALSPLRQIDVASATRMTLSQLGGDAPRVRLDRGHVGARVDVPHDGHPKLFVDTPDATLVVVGTVFTVDVSDRDSHDDGGFTSVAVMRGTVVVQKEGVEIARVGAGQTWSSRPPRAPSTPREDVIGDSEPSSVAPRAAKRRARSGASGQATPVGAAADSVSGTLAVENRLYQQAIAARNRGDDATVVRRMGELLRAFPQSPLVGEARRERDRALERLGTDRPEEAP
jgi:hypothetical protein